jgi:hypothetical protein
MTSSNASGKNKDGAPRNEETTEVVSEITPMLPPKRENTAITLNRVSICSKWNNGNICSGRKQH